MRRLLRIRTLVFMSFLFIIPASSFAQIGVGVSIRIGPPPLPVYARNADRSRRWIHLDARLLGLWTSGLLLGSRRVGDATASRTVVDAGLLGLCWWDVWMACGVLGTTCRILWRHQLWLWVRCYGGVGFFGGRWAGEHFMYNTAVMNVNTTVVRNVYVDRTVINNTTVVNHASFNGEGGVSRQATPEEQNFGREQHFDPTSNQISHEHTASMDHTQLASENHGRPATAAMDSVNGRRYNQQGRIANGISSGQLTPGETKNLEGREAGLNNEVHNDRSANGGTLTPQERQQVNRQQNNVSKSIYNDKHNAATDTYGNNEVGARRDMQQQRIANGVRSGQMSPSETAKTENHEQNINRNIATDRQANGGKLTPEEKRNINRQQNGASKQIRNEKHNEKTVASLTRHVIPGKKRAATVGWPAAGLFLVHVNVQWFRGRPFGPIFFGTERTRFFQWSAASVLRARLIEKLDGSTVEFELHGGNQIIQLFHSCCADNWRGNCKISRKQPRQGNTSGRRIVFFRNLIERGENFVSTLVEILRHHPGARTVRRVGRGPVFA